MREIKFRAWNIGAKIMTYLDVESVSHYYENFTETKENVILMQYTGLKDKNGKEIYEGDIVRAYGYKCKVRFAHGAFIIGYHNGSSTTTRPQLIQGMVEEKATKIEVIGNIYENPDLLK